MHIFKWYIRRSYLAGTCLIAISICLVVIGLPKRPAAVGAPALVASPLVFSLPPDLLAAEKTKAAVLLANLSQTERQRVALSVGEEAGTLPVADVELAPNESMMLQVPAQQLRGGLFRIRPLAGDTQRLLNPAPVAGSLWVAALRGDDSIESLTSIAPRKGARSAKKGLPDSLFETGRILPFTTKPFSAAYKNGEIALEVTRLCKQRCKNARYHLLVSFGGKIIESQALTIERNEPSLMINPLSALGLNAARADSGYIALIPRSRKEARLNTKMTISYMPLEPNTAALLQSMAGDVPSFDMPAAAAVPAEVTSYKAAKKVRPNPNSKIQCGDKWCNELTEQCAKSIKIDPGSDVCRMKNCAAAGQAEFIECYEKGEGQLFYPPGFECCNPKSQICSHDDKGNPSCVIGDNPCKEGEEVCGKQCCDSATQTCYFDFQNQQHKCGAKSCATMSNPRPGAKECPEKPGKFNPPRFICCDPTTQHCANDEAGAPQCAPGAEEEPEKRCWACIYEPRACTKVGENSCEPEGPCKMFVDASESSCMSDAEYQCRAFQKGQCKDKGANPGSYDQCFAYPIGTNWSQINGAMNAANCDIKHASRFAHSNETKLPQCFGSIKYCIKEGFGDYKDWGCRTFSNLWNPNGVWDYVTQIQQQANKEGVCLEFVITGNQCTVKVGAVTDPGRPCSMTSTRMRFLFCGEEGNPVTVTADECLFDVEPKVMCDSFFEGGRPSLMNETAFCLNDKIDDRPYGENINITNCQKCSQCRQETAADGKKFTICNWKEVPLSECEASHGGPPKATRPKAAVDFFNKTPDALCKKAVDKQAQLAIDKLALPSGSDTSELDRKIREAGDSATDLCLAVPPLEQPATQLPTASELMKAIKAKTPLAGEQHGIITLEMTVDSSKCQCSDPCQCDLSASPMNPPGDYSLAFGNTGLCASGPDCGNISERDDFCRVYPGYGYTACVDYNKNNTDKCAFGGTPALCPSCNT